MTVDDRKENRRGIRRRQQNRARKRAGSNLVEETIVELPPRRNCSTDVDTVIMACSGPSLNLVDIWAPGLPVCAVSTVIRDKQFLIHRPEYWILVDRINPNHGPTAYSIAMAEDVVKVIPNGRAKIFSRFPNVMTTPRESRQKDRKLDFGTDGKILSGFNQSSSFACQWLSLAGGFTTVVFAGCDFRSGIGAEHCHNRRLQPRSRVRQAKTLKMVAEHLRKWTATAQEMGITFLCGSPGSVLEDFMETYEWPMLTTSSSSVCSTSP